MSGRLPGFLIIGALRSGTTSLSVYLGEHPDVFIPAQKEVRFFDRRFDLGPDWYERQFDGAAADALIGEASPGYMYHAAARSRMADALPDARLIAILRDPVDRAYSHYWMNRSLGIESLGFEEAIEREPERLASGKRPDAYGYLDRGRFLGQLTAVCERYDRGRLHVLLFEDLRRDPGASYKEVCRFLQIPDDVLPPALGDQINGYVEFRSLPMRGIARRMPSGAQRVLDRVNTRRKVTYPPLAPALRAELSARFRQDNQDLEAWLGRDLSAWSHTASTRP